jgi:hypothetical protein
VNRVLIHTEVSHSLTLCGNRHHPLAKFPPAESVSVRAALGGQHARQQKTLRCQYTYGYVRRYVVRTWAPDNPCNNHGAACARGGCRWGHQGAFVRGRPQPVPATRWNVGPRRLCVGVPLLVCPELCHARPATLVHHSLRRAAAAMCCHCVSELRGGRACQRQRLRRTNHGQHEAREGHPRRRD